MMGYNSYDSEQDDDDMLPEQCRRRNTVFSISAWPRRSTRDVDCWDRNQCFVVGIVHAEIEPFRHDPFARRKNSVAYACSVSISSSPRSVPSKQLRTPELRSDMARLINSAARCAPAYNMGVLTAELTTQSKIEAHEARIYQANPQNIPSSRSICYSVQRKVDL